MQIVLSCAKDMSSREEVMQQQGLTAEEMAVWPMSIPLFRTEAEEAAAEMAVKSPEEISRMLRCNPDLALLNRGRFARFGTQEAVPMQAALTYSGVAFRELNAAQWDADTRLLANSHLWIVSFLYGLLRPMDGMLPYRMEGNVRLKRHGQQTMFEWWKTRLTQTLLDSVSEDDGILLWCSTDEMKKMVDWKRLTAETTVLEPEFLIKKGSEMKAMSVYSKKCRGTMARGMLVSGAAAASPERIQDLLKHFYYEGFRLEENSEIHSEDGIRKFRYIKD